LCPCQVTPLHVLFHSFFSRFSRGRHPGAGCSVRSTDSRSYRGELNGELLEDRLEKNDPFLEPRLGIFFVAAPDLVGVLGDDVLQDFPENKTSSLSG